MKKNKVFIIILILAALFAIGTVVFASDIINPDDYHSEPSISSSGEAMSIVKTILGVINVIGVIILVSTIALLGIKYITGSLEERAEYKKSMIPILVGAFLLFSTSTLINIVYNIFYEEGRVYTYTDSSASTRQQATRQQVIVNNTSTSSNTGNTGTYNTSSSSNTSTSSNSSGIGSSSSIPDSALQQKLNNETKDVQTKNYNGMNYILKLPEGATTNMPIIIYLHGSEEIGKVNRVKSQQITNYFANGNVDGIEKCIYVAPVLNSGTWNGSSSYIMGIINSVINEYGADSNRILLTGFSWGSYGLWKIVNSYPNTFAAALAVDGAEYADENLNYSNWTTPIYAVYGQWEGTAGNNGNATYNYPYHMENVIDKIRTNGNNVEIKTNKINNGNHGDVATSVYNDSSYYRWLLNH